MTYTVSPICKCKNVKIGQKWAWPGSGDLLLKLWDIYGRYLRPSVNVTLLSHSLQWRSLSLIPEPRPYRSSVYFIHKLTCWLTVGMPGPPTPAITAIAAAALQNGTLLCTATAITLLCIKLKLSAHLQHLHKPSLHLQLSSIIV